MCGRAEEVRRGARAVQDAGAFPVVIEKVPAEIGATMREAFGYFVGDVRSGEFPNESESY